MPRILIPRRECSPKLVLERAEALLIPVPPPAVVSTPATVAREPSCVPSATGAVTKSNADRIEPDTRHAFLEQASDVSTHLRNGLRVLIKSANPAAQSAALDDLYQLVHALTGQARVTGFVRISHLASALEVLLREMHQKPARITPSILNTLARAVDCLRTLFGQARHWPEEDVATSTLVLAVDDEPLALQTLAAALTRANLKAVSLDDPELALSVLALNRFDLIFLDAEMPKMHGFAVCKRLRAMPTNHTTPVVYVTARSNFEARSRAALSGGNDFIAKPFPLSEVAVKALTLLVRAKPEVTLPARVMGKPDGGNGQPPVVDVRQSTQQLTNAHSA